MLRRTRVANHIISNRFRSVRIGSIVIGDEILKGYVTDTNTSFLARTLFSAGIKNVVILPDDKETIAQHVRTFSSKYDYVITSGGIGPTHDDITFESVAEAFDQELRVNAVLEKLVVKFFGSSKGAQLKLATVPSETVLILKNADGQKFRYPIVSVNNVIVLPGIPQLFERSIAGLVGYWTSDSKNYSVELKLNCNETDVADILTQTQNLFSDVNIGSYPQWSNNYFKVLLKMDGTTEDRVEKCRATLVEQISPEKIVTAMLDPMSLDGNDVYNIANEQSDLGFKVRTAVSVIEEALDKYEEKELSIAFNGGKDCTAVLHLFFAVLKKRGRSNDKLKSLYIQSDKQQEIFTEMEDFLAQTNTRYNMEVITSCGHMKSALAEIKSARPEIKGILMGTRIDDPHGKYVSQFSLTDVDKGWPEFMRINPILNWTYKDVWKFLRVLQLPYCVLYDRGYTSLGNKSTTVPNPELKLIDSSGKISYRPAYMLDMDAKERSGRC